MTFSRLSRVCLSVLALSAPVPLSAQTPATQPATTAPAEPTNVSGSYTWQQMTRGGPVDITLTLVQEGEKLTGTLTSAFQGELTLENGLVRGNNFSFQITNPRGGELVVTLYTGTVSGQTLKLRAEQLIVRTFEARKN